MVKPSKYSRAQLVNHFTIPLNIKTKLYYLRYLFRKMHWLWLSLFHWPQLKLKIVLEQIQPCTHKYYNRNNNFHITLSTFQKAINIELGFVK